MIQILKSIPEKHRWKVYVACFALLALTFVTLLVVDVWQGGDAGEWIKWVASVLGLGGTGLAFTNTDRHGL